MPWVIIKDNNNVI